MHSERHLHLAHTCLICQANQAGRGNGDEGWEEQSKRGLHENMVGFSDSRFDYGLRSTLDPSAQLALVFFRSARTCEIFPTLLVKTFLEEKPQTKIIQM